jgi:CBS domain containing-hemolysin-like protein
VSIRRRAGAGEAAAILVQGVLDRVETFLGTTLVGTNLALISATSLADSLVSRYDWAHEYAGLLNVLFMTPLVLVVGELLPKSIGRARSEQVSLLAVRPLLFAYWLLSPLVLVVSWLSGLCAGLFGRGDARRSVYVTREDLAAMAALAAEEGLVEGASGTMLQTVFELDKRPVSGVMVPLVSVRSLALAATVEDLEQLAMHSGHSRFPVHARRVDDVVGIVDLRRVLYEIADQDDPVLRRRLSIEPFVDRDLLFVPETKSVGSLLHELRVQPQPMAAVVDEHGGVVGIVTVEDLIEEVVGEIQDERDRESHDVTRIDDSAFECDGKLAVRDLSEHLGVEIPPDGFETVGGWIMKTAGHIPTAGESFDANGYEVQVVAMDRRRVSRVRFRRLPPPAAT